jgi:hypothetical protein
MSMYYSPEIVRALMKVRILDAQEARRTADCACDTRVFRTQGRMSRLLPLRPAPAACAC